MNEVLTVRPPCPNKGLFYANATKGPIPMIKHIQDFVKEFVRFRAEFSMLFHEFGEISMILKDFDEQDLIS